MTDKRSSPVKAIIGADKVVGLMTEDGLNVPGFDGTGYVTDEELEERLEPASLSDLKAGISTKKPIVPLCQHQSIFYALAKAAGANLASSTEETAPDGTNTGVYPEAAKTAIKNMLGISEGGGSTKIYQHSVNLTIRARERDYITGTILYSSSSAPMTAEEFIEKVKDTWLPLQGYNVTDILLGLALGQYLYYFVNGSNTSPTYVRVGASSITSLTDVVVEL